MGNVVRRVLVLALLLLLSGVAQAARYTWNDSTFTFVTNTSDCVTVFNAVKQYQESVGRWLGAGPGVGISVDWEMSGCAGAVPAVGGVYNVPILVTKKTGTHPTFVGTWSVALTARQDENTVPSAEAQAIIVVSSLALFFLGFSTGKRR